MRRNVEPPDRARSDFFDLAKGQATPKIPQWRSFHTGSAARGNVGGLLRRRRASFRHASALVPNQQVFRSEAVTDSTIALCSATPENRLALFEEGSHTLCIILAVVHHATQALHPFEALV